MGAYSMASSQYPPTMLHVEKHVIQKLGRAVATNKLESGPTLQLHDL